jgi:hypothetical protein
LTGLKAVSELFLFYFKQSGQGVPCITKKEAVSELWHTHPLDLCAKGIKRDSLGANIVPGRLRNAHG